jgi:hypothetical protein
MNKDQYYKWCAKQAFGDDLFIDESGKNLRVPTIDDTIKLQKEITLMKMWPLVQFIQEMTKHDCDSNGNRYAKRYEALEVLESIHLDLNDPLFSNS